MNRKTAPRSLFIMLSCLMLTLLTHSPLSSPALAGQEAKEKQEVVYTCVMDPDVRSKTPGKCPKCGMTLRVASNDAAKPADPPVEKTDGPSITTQIPDTAVYNQDGKRLNFYTDLVKGKTVAINFIFTTCTTICPPLTATFRKVQQDLGERAGKEVELISVSVDPATDVPERLKAFSQKFKAGPGWQFITGSKPDIDRLLAALGAGVSDRNDHTPMVLVGNDAAGYWTRTYGLSPPSTIMKVIDEAAGKKSAGRPAEPQPVKKPSEAAATYFPNNVLVTQDNKQVRFFDDLLKGKVVMINFAFSTCTGVCPPMTANLAKAQEFLGDRVGRDINMITISVDPLIDTPEALKKYASSFKVKPGWYFLTGKKEDVDQVLKKLGGFAEDKLQHSSVLIVGNVETGEWSKVFAMAKPAEIANAVIKLAGPGK